jgi:Fur family ferric uptake transcriptional regulator
MAGEHGFVNITHTVEIFGTCGDCADQPAATGAPAARLTS